MKAITIRQPWASLIAAGVKTIETRPRRTHYRGRIAIHAGAARPPFMDLGSRQYVEAMYENIRHTDDCYCDSDGVADTCARQSRSRMVLTRDEKLWMDLPLGAVVASAVLTDCVPADPRKWTGDGGYRGWFMRGDGAEASMTVLRDGHRRGPWAWDEQRPFGDYSPGRWALLLDDIAPTTERCPACWGCGNTAGVTYTLGPGWDTTGGVSRCPTCHGAGRCDPVPARGKQTVPWEWTP